MKKTLFLLVVLCYTLMANAANEHAKKIGNIYYFLNSNNTAGVTWGKSLGYATDEYTGDIHIPNTVEYDGVTYDVTYIGDDAFCGCTGLSSITLPDNLQIIQAYAFKGCTGLSSVSLPNEVTNIMSNAFDGCTNISSIILPEKLQAIGNSTFAGCIGLTSVSIPSKVTNIGGYAFSGTTNLKEVFVYSELLTTVESGVWSKEIPTYVKATSFKNYKANLLKSYNIKVLPNDGNIGDAIKEEFNFSAEEAKVINMLLSIRNTMGKQQAGPAIEVIDQDGKVLQLHNPTKVNFIKVDEQK